MQVHERLAYICSTFPSSTLVPFVERRDNTKPQNKCWPIRLLIYPKYGNIFKLWISNKSVLPLVTSALLNVKSCVFVPFWRGVWTMLSLIWGRDWVRRRLRPTFCYRLFHQAWFQLRCKGHKSTLKGVRNVCNQYSFTVFSLKWHAIPLT